MVPSRLSLPTAGRRRALRCVLLPVWLLLACGEDSGPRPEPLPVDTTAPQLQVHSPTAGWNYTSRRVRVALTATDDTRLATLSWSLNGAGFLPLPAEARTGDTFLLEVAPRPGSNTLTVWAEDGAGNSTGQTVAFHFGSLSGSGAAHTGVVRQGRVYLWGRNNLGQLGLGEEVVTDQRAPRQVPGLEGVAALALNQNHTLALLEDGTVWAWGENAQGQLGLGPAPVPGAPRPPDVAPRRSPTRVEGLKGAVALALGYRHSLALMEDGTVRAFGDNSAGQLGDGTAERFRDFPVGVGGLTQVVKVVAGSMHSVALKQDGTVWVWGRNTYGNLGQGTQDGQPHPTPVQVPGVTDVVDIASGRDHLLALHAGGTVSAWGLDASGQLGFGEAFPDKQSNAPVPVKALEDARFVFANGNMSYAQRAGGTLVSWGQNFNGQLGNGGTKDTNVPVAAAEGLTGLWSLSPGATHVVALREDGTLFTWGWSFSGSLGREYLLDRWTYPEPIQVTLP
ncbi:RCC1 domain-containing protein [Stigmatella hybrida]|uniref:RCC1 domain-containing protein n=1 Tax=Stigmatella hybrida TaxID=394097 RepID=UPI0021E15F4D|nr:chromosome condensation regulator RCC1 [Stigmatella hybrida]